MFASTLLGLLLLSFLAIVKAQSITDSGWRPISSEKVFTSRSSIKTPVNRNFEDARHPTEFTDGENIKFTNAREMYYRNIYPPGSHFNEKELDRDPDGNIDENKVINENEDKLSFNRKAKTIPSQFVNNEVIKTSDIKQNDDVKTNNEYKVNEENTDVTGEQSNIIVNENYQTHERNPTKDFLKILSNYNIRSSDKLPNYSLSLRQNSRHSPSKDFIYINVPIKLPLSYNSPNHLLVDPLIAVLLSNYGYYLPGYYGVNGKYQNLYGYSAANNIHNNKPFGSYKIFSDTDSYNVNY
ncbi:unnamed protein product [Leptosia nina]|uniref:Uncharacterized protein n=1 Tax=Leptosia nina TaxID=320188 RepID=A0AAV1IYJ5_9NEOP